MVRPCHTWVVVVGATLLGSLICSHRALAQQVVLESAVMGTPGRFGGTSITTSQFIGWRFQIADPLAVEQIGGHLLSLPDEPGDIFAAIVRLDSIDAVPHGAPFDADEIVATTTFRPTFPSSEIFVPLSTTLSPGAYTLVYGTGLFGATGAGAAHNGDDQPDIPPTNLSSFIYWSIPFFGQPFEWRLNLASHIRFVIEAHVLDLPGDVNNDGFVDIFDVNVVSAHWGEAGPAGDANGDMMVDIFDINLISANWTPEDGSALAVPEPAAVLLGVLGSLTLAVVACRQAGC